MSQHLTFKNILKTLLSVSVMMSITAHAQYRTADPADENDPDAPRFWEETEVKIPTAPPSKDLKPFYVSASTQLKFALDAPSIAFGKDEVIRYVVVITSPSGASARCNSHPTWPFLPSRTVI